MQRLKVGDEFTAYFGGELKTSTVVEWIGNRCYFANGWYLVWGGEHIGFRY